MSFDYSLINKDDFSLAMQYLDRLTEPATKDQKPLEKFKNHGSQSQIKTALFILNKAAEEGSDQQKDTLSLKSRNIKNLNNLLKQNPAFSERAQKLGLCTKEEAAELRNLQIALPDNMLEKAATVVSVIPRVLSGAVHDLLALPFAGFSLLVRACSDPNPSEPSKKHIPIVLLHGSGYNDSQFLLYRRWTGTDRSYSLNYAEGLFSNDSASSIKDYASSKKMVALFERIQKETGQTKFIIAGHSMGGPIGLEVARLARNTKTFGNIRVVAVILLNAPVRGTPMITVASKISSVVCCSNKELDQRKKEMSVANFYRDQLYTESLQAERDGKLKIYTYGSKTDFACPGDCTSLTEDPRRKYQVSYQGHFTSMLSFSVGWQSRKWIKEIDAAEAAKPSNAANVV